MTYCITKEKHPKHLKIKAPYTNILLPAIGRESTINGIEGGWRIMIYWQLLQNDEQREWFNRYNLQGWGIEFIDMDNEIDKIVLGDVDLEEVELWLRYRTKQL